ncbi:hypothetical protein ACVCFZ_12670 [Acinetobacter variabilis]|uniref:hypothetical protein n=1 Tax=Acinetobacter variabilis TaxID=70346 RepID=UPI0035D512FA
MTDLTLTQITDSLASLYIFKGIQPSELADSIFEESYVDMISERKMDKIEVTLTFNEKCEITGKIYTHHMKYIYDECKFLMKIKEAVNSKKFKTVWDRTLLINSSLDKLSKTLENSNYSDNQIQKILDTIPKDFNLRNSKTLKIAC